MLRGFWKRTAAQGFALLVWALPAWGWAYDNLDLGKPSEEAVMIDREGYAVGFSSDVHQARWVTYHLTRAEVRAPRVSREGKEFMEDPALPAGSVSLEDYRRSGYARGHLAPAADMAWSEKTMTESFYLSNITPQTHTFTAGIWADLERLMRYWATVEGEVWVVTGPIFSEGAKTIGPHKVPVPSAFYKVVYAPRKGGKAIGFIVPHKDSTAPLQSFSVSVDDVEKATGLDFFNLLPDAREKALESTFDTSAWKW